MEGVEERRWTSSTSQLATGCKVGIAAATSASPSAQRTPTPEQGPQWWRLRPARVAVGRKIGEDVTETMDRLCPRKASSLICWTLADWVGASAVTLMPLIEAIRAHVFAAERIQPTTRRCRCSQRAIHGPTGYARHRAAIRWTGYGAAIAALPVDKSCDQAERFHHHHRGRRGGGAGCGSGIS